MRIGHLHTHLQGAGFRIDCGVDKIDLAGEFVFAAVGQTQPERWQSAHTVIRVAVELALQLQQLQFADGEVHINRIHRVQGRQQRGRRVNQTARLDQRLADHAVARRADSGVFKVEFSATHLGPRGLLGGGINRFPGHRRIKILLTQSALLDQRTHAFELLLRIQMLGLGQGQRGLHL